MQLRTNAAVVCFAALLGSVAGVAPHATKHADAAKLGLRGGAKKPVKDVSAVPAQLSAMIATSQRQLAIAEKHHEKAVEKARGRYTDLLSDKASSVGKDVRAFGAELDRAVDVLQEAVNASKAALALPEPESTGFASSLVQTRARLSAEVDAAMREIRRDQRKRDHAVHEAVTQGGNSLEEGSQKLSRRTGDLSQLIDDAKSSLEAIATSTGATDDQAQVDVDVDMDMDMDDMDAPANATKTATKNATNATNATHVALANITNATHAMNATNATKKAALPKQANEAFLKTVLAQLDAAKAQSKSIADAAQKKIDASMAKADSDVVSEVTKIQKDLSDAEKLELERVRGKPTKLF